MRCFLLIVMISLSGCDSGDHSHQDHDHDHDHHPEERHEHAHDEHDEHERMHVTVSADLVDRIGIVTTAATGGELRETLDVVGRVTLSPDRVSHVEARYPGLIRSVKVRIGEPVTVGQVLATVESNESLREYAIPAPIDGIVIERHANNGEFTGGRLLFTLADYSVLALELPIFSKDMMRVRTGQMLTLTSSGRTAESQIVSMTPQIVSMTPHENGAPIIVARAPLDNADNVWTPGETLRARVDIALHQVALRVENTAIQQVKGNAVVFVEREEGSGRVYEARPVDLGRSDGRFTEVLGGLDSGERYVVRNAYVLKADLEKSGAAHEH